jgi:NADH:ubiquinone oxidoreductase subunit 4 (subunit M)
MPQVGFEPTISVFHQAKTVHALDCVASVIGFCVGMLYVNMYTKSFANENQYSSRMYFINCRNIDYKLGITGVSDRLVV